MPFLLKNLKYFLLIIISILLSFYFVFSSKTQANVNSNFTITIIPAPQCFDGIDNDGDGFIDFPNDPNCTSYTDDSEFPDPPSGGGGGGGSSGGGGGGISPPTTGITFTGMAYPLSKVTILKDGQIAVETIAGPDAKFKVAIGNLSPGNYNFTVRSMDQNNIPALPFSFPIFISQGSTTDVSGIFLAPTIEVDKLEVRRGDNIKIFGQTVPDSSITIEVNSETQIFLDTKSDKDGVYFYNFNSAPLEYGGHDTQSKTQLKDNTLSEYGRRVAFTVGNTNVPKIPGEKICRADLNGDGKVNLIDFSIAAFWYNKVLSVEIATKELECLNGDRKINLVDFSIMAFYWTG